MQTASVCKNLQWLLQGATFSSDFLLLPLGNVDIVLGLQWLNTLGRILFDFRNRTIEFIHQGRKHVLRGATTQLKTAKAKALSRKSDEQNQFFMISLLTPTGTDFQCNNIHAAQGIDLLPTLVALMEPYKSIFEIPTNYVTSPQRFL